MKLTTINLKGDNYFSPTHFTIKQNKQNNFTQ